METLQKQRAAGRRSEPPPAPRDRDAALAAAGSRSWRPGSCTWCSRRRIKAIVIERVTRARAAVEVDRRRSLGADRSASGRIGWPSNRAERSVFHGSGAAAGPSLSTGARRSAAGSRSAPAVRRVDGGHRSPAGLSPGRAVQHAHDACAEAAACAPSPRRPNAARSSIAAAGSWPTASTRRRFSPIPPKSTIRTRSRAAVCGALDECDAADRQAMAKKLRGGGQFTYLQRKVSPDEEQRIRDAEAERRRVPQGEPPLLSEQGTGRARPRLRRPR